MQAKSTGFIAYYRVSTDRQGRSGLGLEAQRAAVVRYLAGIGGILIAEHTEVETGSRNDRPELAKALAACRKHKARLVIAKLDRLSRNVAFIATLMDSGVEFVACDNPHATRLTLHILAAVAEHEREMISARTKAALQAAKVRGVRLGRNAERLAPAIGLQCFGVGVEPVLFRAPRATGRRDDRVPFRRTDQQEIAGIDRHTDMLAASASASLRVAVSSDSLAAFASAFALSASAVARSFLAPAGM